MKGSRFLKRVISVMGADCRISYAQCGEDLMLRLLFNLLGIPRPTYLDIGAHHPTYLSNTYQFYKNGSRGVCVEPDPNLCKTIKSKRPEDTCLNVGVATGEFLELDFYILDDPSLNTFSKEVKDEQVCNGRTLVETLKVSTVNINELIRKHFTSPPDFITLDTEGLDLAILKTFDFNEIKPICFCVETLTNITDRKMFEIINFMLGKGYIVFADTYINTIFVEHDRWVKRASN